MAAFPLYPYTNRKLGVQQQLTPKESCMDFSTLATICLANLRPGDQVECSDTTLEVVQIDEHKVLFTSGHAVHAEGIQDTALHQHLVKTLPTYCPEYRHPLVAILERDPAVFRLRTGGGWVVNDALCLMSGNVQYTMPSRENLPPPEPTPTVSIEHAGKAEPGKTQLSLF